MKGIMFKEFFLSKKFTVFGLATYFIAFTMFVLVKLSILYGNIGKLPPKTVATAESVLYYVMPLSLALVLYVSVMTNNTKHDITSKWNRYAYTLPLSEKQIIGASYLYNAVGFCAVTIINFIVYFIALALYGDKFDYRMLFIIMGIGALCFVVLGLNKLFMLIFKGNTSRSRTVLCCIYMGLYFGIGLGVGQYITHFFESRGYELDDQDNWPPEASAEFEKHIAKIVETVKDNLWWSVPIILITLGVIFFTLSVKALKRREN